MASLIADPTPNLMARPYSSLSVQEVDVELTTAALTAYLMGREVYYQTEYLALRRGPDVALVAVRKKSDRPLFSPVVEVRVLAEPDEALWVTSPTTDVGNPTAMAETAIANHRNGIRAYLVQGRFEHANFIWEPKLTRVRVRDVLPPDAPKLFDMTREALAFDSDVPPIELVLDAVDIVDIAAQHPAPSYLIPCGGSRIELAAPVEYLDTRPAYQPGWLLIGCEQSKKLYRHFYGENPNRVDICPMRRTDRADPELTLAKCCLIADGIRVVGASALVGWGASRDDLRRALRVLTGVETPPAAAFDPVPTETEPESPATAGVLHSVKC
jgi:hypothetical protein